MLSFLMTLLLSSSCVELTHFCAGDETPPKAKDHLPIGSCWYCGEIHEEPCPFEEEEEDDGLICVDNCIYECLNPCCLRGVWLPEAPPLFLPFKADPRQLAASAGWRFYDQVIGKHVIDVSYFDTIQMYRWFNIGLPCGQLEFDIDGALWAVFEPTAPTSPLVNADYYVGGSLNYAWDSWSFRFRAYHISSHIGDEFLLEHPGFDRRNPSAEYVDLYASYYLDGDTLRLYLGGGYIVHRDPSFRCERIYGEAGAELYFPWFHLFSTCHMIQGRPYFAVNLRCREEHDWDLDQTYVLGYEFAKLYGLERKLRFYFEYHEGYSLEGQFCHARTDYFSFRISYGF